MLNLLLPVTLQWVAVLPAQMGCLANRIHVWIEPMLRHGLESAMKKLGKKRLLFVIAMILNSVIVLFAGQGLAGYPGWINRPPQERNAIVVVGVATARTLDQGQRAAILNAASQVAEHIELTVHGSGTKVRTAVEQRFEDEVKFSTGRTPLHGGLVKEWYFEEVSGSYQVFVLVHYPLAEIENVKARLKSEEAERITRARMWVRQGQATWEKGEVLEALRSFSEALRASKGVGQDVLETEASGKVLSLLQSLDLSITSGDGQEVKPGGKQAVVAVRITSRLEGEKIPVEGVPVRFQWGEKTVKKKKLALTDSNGEARLILDRQVSAMFPTGIQRVTASLDKEDLLARIGLHTDDEEDNGIAAIGQQVELPIVTFTLKVVPRPRFTRILLLIEETNMGRFSNESIVMQTLSEALQQAGFRVVAEHEIGKTNIERLQAAIRKERLWPLRPELAHEADLVLIGTALTRKGSDNMGVVISSQADLFIRAVDLKSGDVVAQKNVLSQAGFGDTPELAGIKALSEAGRLAAESLVDQLTLREEGKTDADR